MYIYTLILLIILISTISLSKITENYSSLDTIYPNKIGKQKPDICGECGGLCQFCNHGVDNPLNCNNSAGNYKNGYLNPQNVKINAIDSPNNYKCLNDKTVNKLISANYVYIYSNPFKKSLSFESYGNKSYVYVDKKTPTNNDCLTNDQYEEQCKQIKEKRLPQKWRIDIKNVFNTNVCLVTISSYSCNGLKYYLTAHENGSLSVSLFGGSDNQVWQIYKNSENVDNTIGENMYLIKSHKYCTYLTCNNQGYMKNESGTTSLTNITKNIGKELMWNIDTCGKRKIDIKMQNSSYKPFQSTTDFPYVNDNIGPKDVLPKDLKVSDDINKKWAGRSVWMKEFSEVWNHSYKYQTYKKTNTLAKVESNSNQENLYKIVSKIEPIELNMNINLDNEGNGIIKIDLLETKIEPKDVEGQIVSYAGLTKQKNYDNIVNTIKTTFYKVKNYGAKVLKGNNDNSDIFIENINDKQIKITITNKDGTVKLSTVAKKM